MNQSLLEILLVFFSEPPDTKRMSELCNTLDCLDLHELDGLECENCILARCNSDYSTKVHENLDQIETTIRVITDEYTTTPNNK